MSVARRRQRYKRTKFELTVEREVGHDNVYFLMMRSFKLNVRYVQ